jgi:hypothetical protein
MGFETLNLGIELTLPTAGTTNWSTQLKNTTWTKISEHRHTGGGDGNKIPTEGLAANIGWTQASQTPSGAALSVTLDFNEGNVHLVDLSGFDGEAAGAISLNLSNPNQGSLYTIILEQGTVPRTSISGWPGSVKWPQGQEPLLTEVAGAKDKITLYFDGTDYFGDWNLDYK